MPTRSPIVIFRCDASPVLGYGHVSRCLSVARALRALRPWTIVFVLGSAHARDQIVQNSFNARVLPPSTPLEAWLENILRELRPDLLFLDAPKGFPQRLAADRAADGELTVVLDDAGPLRRYAQAVYYPPAPAVRTLDWTGCDTEVFCGFGWVPLGASFSPQMRTPASGPPRLLITMGGSDPAKLTLRALDLLQTEPMRNIEWSARIIVGPYFAFRNELYARLQMMHVSVDTVESPSNMGALMASSDFAMGSFGVSAYELAACGVPAAYFCLTPEHANMAEVFVNEGMAMSFGVHGEVNVSEAASRVAALLQDAQAQEHMGRRAAMLVDGRGAQRIAEDMTRRLEARL